MQPSLDPKRSPLLVTGANGQLGRGLARSLGAPEAIRAVVRSERAAEMLRELPEPVRPEIRILDPTDVNALATAAEGCRGWVHLVGILKEGARARYRDAHENSARSVAAAASRAGIPRIVYLSILGASPESTNACLASKGRAESILLEAEVPATVLRLPMVLGRGEIAARALHGQASAPFTLLVRGGASLEQPIDTRDAVAAILAALELPGSDNAALDLAGPNCLSHRELVMRVAERLGTRPRVVPLPLLAARAFAALASLVPTPPLTPAMLGVLEHDDCIDPEPACGHLGLKLTPLFETLDHTFANAHSEDPRP